MELYFIIILIFMFSCFSKRMGIILKFKFPFSWKIISNILEKWGWIQIYRTNLVKGVPIDEDGKIRYPNREEKRDGLLFLKEEISRFKPKLVYLFWKQVSDFLAHIHAVKICENEYIHSDTVFICVEHPAYIATYKRKQIPHYIARIIERMQK